MFINNFRDMRVIKNVFYVENIEAYTAPTTEVVQLRNECGFLESNTEKIDDDGEEHGWD